MELDIVDAFAEWSTGVVPAVPVDDAEEEDESYEKGSEIHSQAAQEQDE